MDDKLIYDDNWTLAYEYVKYTNCNIFLTGRAGTGKTTFLQSLKQIVSKRMVVVAPTGVAAINAGGVTIHSFFQLPFGPMVPAASKESPEKKNRYGVNNKLRKEKIDIIRSLDLLVIDEISMVRSDLLDAIDGVLRQYRHNNKPFGGVQLLMIGDLQQLAPVVKADEWDLLKEYYDTPFFYGSNALQRSKYITIELTHIFRQQDDEFISLLNKIRNGATDIQTMNKLNSKYVSDIDSFNNDDYIILTTHNNQAKEINDNRLSELRAKKHSYEAIIDGDFPMQSYPTDAKLILKKGAQVMFVKNDPSPEKQFFNGKIGVITKIDDDTVEVTCKGDDEPIIVSPLEWENMKYSIDNDTKEIIEEQIGSFTQMPLKLAWAITIHKSQGLTFDKVIIDAASAFAHGQVYVALSRCKSLDGLVLSSKIYRPSIINDIAVKEFQDKAIANMPTQHDLTDAKREYQEQLITELFDFKKLSLTLNKIKALTTENDSILTGKPCERIADICVKMNDDIIDVSNKFNTQLKNLFAIHSEDKLQERVMAASEYFSAKVEDTIFKPLDDITYETDNKDVKKDLRKLTEELLTGITIKIACLHSSENGFDTTEYLKAKDTASILPLKQKKKTKLEVKPSDGRNEIIDKLKRWREAKADELNIPLYVVIRIKTIETIAATKPKTKQELLEIKGMGKKSVEKYGDEILEIVEQTSK